MTDDLANKAVGGLLWLGSFIILFYAVENWRGARAFMKAKEAYEASGQRQTFRHPRLSASIGGYFVHRGWPTATVTKS